MSLLYTCLLLCDRCGTSLEHKAQTTKSSQSRELQHELRTQGIKHGWSFSSVKRGRVPQALCPGCSRHVYVRQAAWKEQNQKPDSRSVLGAGAALTPEQRYSGWTETKRL